MVNIRYMPRSFGFFSTDKNDDVVRCFFWKRAIDSLKDNNLNPFGVGVAIFATTYLTQTMGDASPRP